MTKTQLFLERIGLSADTKITKNYEFLKLIQYNSVLNIAYENLDILDKKPLKLDAQSLFEKIVTNKRGGYCFEVNALLSWFFKENGFEVKDYFARFLRGEKEIPMRRHRILTVKCDDGVYFCDIGIGQTAPRYPVKLEVGLVQEQFGESYKFEKDERGYVLYDLHKGEWREFISFTEDIAYEIDFVQPSFYCEAHTDSVFNKAPMLAIKTSDGRKTIDGRTYKVFAGDTLLHIEEDITDERFGELIYNEFKIQYAL